MNYSGNVLAFIGDAVLSLQVREYLVELGHSKTKRLQELSTDFVSARSQAKFMEKLLSVDVLTDEEMLIYKRGRNAKSQSMAKNADVKDYRIATGFEALWGYLYLEEETVRLNELWVLFKEEVKV